LFLAIKLQLDKNISGNDFTLIWVQNYLSPQEKKLHNYELQNSILLWWSTPESQYVWPRNMCGANEKCIQDVDGKSEGKRPLGRFMRRCD
jgi:hypothetical protein